MREFSVLLESYDPSRSSRSFQFCEPVDEVLASKPEDVHCGLDKVDEAVRRGLHAAGFVSYEAAAGLDAAFHVRSGAEFPLLWFGLFKERREVTAGQRRNDRTFRLSSWVPSRSRDSYASAIQSVREHIAAGDTYQANFTMRLRSSFEGDDFAFYRALCRSQRAAYCAYVKMGRYRILSASPELFFHLRDGRLTARPMKGTFARGRWSEEDDRHAALLERSAKDRSENVMIVDLLRNDLGRISEVGSVRVPRLFEVERYDTVLQMTSTVTSRLRGDVSVSELFASLFPCGSITGAPKIRTMEIIAELEDSPRRIYTGSIGFISPGPEAVFNVAIRTVLLDTKTGTAECGVGGGITDDSTPDGEYEECMVKARFLEERREDFDLLESLLYESGEGYFLLERHLKRMADSARYFCFRFEETAAREVLERVAGMLALAGGQYKVRLLLSRDGTLRVEHTPVEQKASDVTPTAALASTPIRSDDVFLFHKTTNRSVYESRAASRPDCDSVILWNERGEITESTEANIVAVLDGQAWTPPLESGLLGGTYRAELLEKRQIKERVLRPDDLNRAEAIYLINSVRKWTRVCLVE